MEKEENYLGNGGVNFTRWNPCEGLEVEIGYV